MASPEVGVGSQPEFKTYHTYIKKDGKVTTETLTEAFGLSRHGNATDPDSSYALVIKRTFPHESSNQQKSVTLIVNSPMLLQTFRDVVGSYSAVPSDFNSPFDLKSPFQMLMHYWDELEAYGEETESSEMRAHLSLLFQFMSHELGEDRRILLDMLKNQQITFPTAWAIFRPGTLLYTKVLHFPWVLVCTKTAYEQDDTIGPYLEVYATYTDYNGTSVGEATQSIKIAQKQQFGGDSPAFIADLPILPRKYIADEGLDSRLEERGRKFLGYREMSIEAYDGIAQYMKEPPYSFFDWRMATFRNVWLPYTESGRVVIDRKTFQNDYYGSVQSIRNVHDANPITCPPYVFGFSLARKQWCRLFLDNIDSVKWAENAWDSLILEKQKKQVVQALVTSHTYPDNPRNQPEQKGKGLVVLLHGAPGCGKTLTAELAAEAKKTALIVASLGELNKENCAIVFERELQRFMQYATIWKAVLLLDEADVFLEKREDNPGSAERNALVAVFLKQLEYFSGIAFLTTNRLRTFDAAMSSRIHLALGYKAPDIETRRQLWVQCLGKLPADERDFDDVDDASMSFVDRQINGREISNAVNTARTMAKFEKEKLQTRHIELILSLRAKFQDDVRAEGRKYSFPAGGANALRRTGSIVDEVDEYVS
ncbi:P-loop containing nucleoside triphosphate hydrolase protein [Colletotrichum falcatum]|nr:P-loop containing nucleoside triphosphate hydrolase protein [Colletotrichum falcatum]